MALRLVAAVVGGLGSSDRGVAAVHAEALKAVDKCLKDKSAPAAIKTAAASVIKAVAETGGAGLWANAGFNFEDTARVCIAGLVDPSLTVREAFAAALGEVAAASKAPSAKEATIEQAVTTCLTKPFTDAASAHNRQALTALAQAWIAYLGSMQAKHSADEDFLIKAAAKLIELLASTSGSKAGAAAPDSGCALGNDLGPGQGEMPHAQAAVLYVLRVAVMEQLSETGQRALLERLTGMVSTPVGDAVPAGVVALVGMRLIIDVVGEVSSDEVHRMRQPCITKLTAHPQPLQFQAAGVLSAIAVAEPSSAALLLQECLEKLAAQVQQLTAASAPHASSPRGIRDADDSSTTMRLLKDSVLGFANGAAALVSAATRLSLGIPSVLLLSGLDLGTKCIREVVPDSGAGARVIMEAGYILLGAMCIALPQDIMEPRHEDLLSLWQPALSAEAAQKLDMKRYLTASLAAAEGEMLTEVQWRVAALEALHAFVVGPCTRCGPLQAATLTAMCASLLQPTLDAVCAAPALQDPWRSGSGPNSTFAGAAGLLQLRLLQAYLLLPKPAAFAPEHASILRLCASALKGTSAPSGRSWSGKCGSYSLQRLLDTQDAVLGPAVPGRDPLLDALNSFVGTPGSPPVRPWEQGLPNQTDPASQLAGGGSIQSSAMPFPQAWSLSGALQEAQLCLLGRVMGVCAPAEQVRMLDGLKNSVVGKAGKQQGRGDPQQLLQHGVATRASIAALSGLHTVVDRYKGEGLSEEAVALSTQALATAVLDQGGISEDASLMRAAAQMYACAACIGTNAAAAHLIQSVCKDMAQTPVPARRASLALAVGCIYRSKGGMSLQLGVASAVATLTAVSQACKGAVQLWILHGLCLTANAAGLAYVPYCKGSLAVATQMLMSEEAYAVPGLRAGLGRLANSVVAVLGPELSPGTDVYSKCKALIREIQGFGSRGSNMLLEEDCVAGELEGVLYIQSLILFAPQAVPAEAHLPMLLPPLASRHPALRRAAAATLRHLAEKSPSVMLPARLEKLLFSALDAEVDSDIAAHIQATLGRLLETGAPEQVSYWLSVCSEVALAAAATPAADQQAPSNRLDREAGSDEGEDTDEEDRHTAAALPTPASQPAPAAAVLAGSRRSPAGTPRLRTRHFAISCILSLPAAVGSDPRHFDLKAAQASGSGRGGDWLVVKLQSLVDTGFRLSSGQLESLRPLGLTLLQAVLHHFGSVEDPLLEGHLILEQYRAQFVSALRSCLDSEAPPSLTAAAAALAGGFVEAGLAGSDPLLLTRLMGQLVGLLQTRSSTRQQLYSEWVPLQAYLALLQAHAQFATAGQAVLDAESIQVVRASQQPHYSHRIGKGGAHQQVSLNYCKVRLICSRAGGQYWRSVLSISATCFRQLVAAWVAVVQDYTVLGTHGPLVQAAYTPRLFPAPSLSIIAKLLPNLHSCWPAALTALAATLPQAAGNAEVQEVVQEGDLTALLLDVAELALCRLNRPELAAAISAQSSPGPGQLQAALGALQAVLKLSDATRPLSLDTCCDLMLLFIDISQVLDSMRPKASWDQGSAAASYCSTTQALCQALQAASQAVPPEIATQPQFVPLATNALLVSMALASSVHPGSTHNPGSGHAHAHTRGNSQGGGRSQGEGALHEELHEQAVVLLGCSEEERKQLQAGLESVCQACRHLLCSCSGVLQMQMAIALILAALSIVQCAPPGWSLASLELLIHEALTIQCGKPPVAHQTSGSPTDLLPTLLPSAATTLAHMLEAYFHNGGSSVTQHRGQQRHQQSVEPATKLRTLLSLMAFIGSLACPASKDSVSRSPNLPAAAQHRQQDSREALPAASEHADDTHAQIETHGDDKSVVQLEKDVSGPADSQRANDRQQVQAASARQCQEICLQAFQQAAVSAQCPEDQLQVLHIAYSPPAQDAALTPLHPSDPQWRLACMAAVLPGAVHYLHTLLLEAQNGLSQAQVQVIGEAFRLLLLAINSANSNGNSEAEQRLLAVVLLLLIRDIAPNLTAAPALSDVATKLVTHIASGPASAAFKLVVTALPNQDKLKLQVAMQAVTQLVTKASQSTVLQSKPKAATITLKNFAAFGKS
ncbi:hypothetical protein ABBQ32_001960 [Trebouxia sp. C0010 RCD-2024]